MLKILLLVVVSLATNFHAIQTSKSYIVELVEDELSYTATAQVDFLERESLRTAKHDEILNSLAVAESGEEAPEKLYSYTSAFNAFSAKMSEAHAKVIASHPEVAYVYEDGKYKKDTTYSYKFLGLDKPKTGPWTRTTGTNVIIGMIDDGIWPEDPSFNDEGYSSVPQKFKGKCQPGQNFTEKNCNRKLVGANYFYKGFLASSGMSNFSSNFSDYISARGAYGHGSHTSSIAAGSIVPNAKINGMNFGTAKGIAYSARIAMYKVCWGDPASGFCAFSDIVAGIDRAVSDGVDLISVSLSGSASNYSRDAVVQATYGANLLGVPTIFSAGNNGQSGYATVRNTAPWQLSVAASTMDRRFENSIVLGNGVVIKGIGLTKSTNKRRSIVNGVNVYSSNSTSYSSSFCYPGSLNPIKVKGKIVICQKSSIYSALDQSKAVYYAGGSGMILYLPMNGLQQDTALIDFFYVPAIIITSCQAVEINNYLKNSSDSSTGLITSTSQLTGTKFVEAPQMADFSSKGPNFATYSILKPDITAPGVNIIAAYSQDPRASFLPFNKTYPFRFLSGTSMSCPHVAGAVALVKSLYPSWHPSWIYSAIISTGYTTDNREKPIRDSAGFVATPFDMGGGHLNVTAALDPGLVYGLTSFDYRSFQCTPSGGFPSNCTGDKNFKEIDLNLPSLSLFDLRSPASVTRNLTLVAKAGSTYRARVISPAGANVSVTPSQLAFKKYGQSLSYEIKVIPVLPYTNVSVNYQINAFTFGSVVWSDGIHDVKLNLAVNVPSDFKV